MPIPAIPKTKQRISGSFIYAAAWGASAEKMNDDALKKAYYREPGI
jgi:hypothetical protein